MSRNNQRDEPFEVPVAIIVFNRPTLTKKLLEVLGELRPRNLFVIADGPRESSFEDIRKCEEVRTLVRSISWECEVRYNISEKNLGCRERPISGITWLFEHVEQAVILEDDCIPDLSFFKYCEDLLEKYKNTREVGLIAGTNPYSNSLIGETGDSYSFSKFPQIWGWATWKETWQNYDANLRAWKGFSSSSFSSMEISAASKRHWTYYFNLVSRTDFDAWDYQLAHSLFENELLTAIPSKNLISNKGFGLDGTHTLNPLDRLSSMEKSPLIFPLVHPAEIVVNKELDDLIEKKQFSMPIWKLVFLGVLAYLKIDARAVKAVFDKWFLK